MVLLSLAAALAPSAASAQALPAGGDFESSPITYSASASAAPLSTISAAQAGDATNHFLRTTYGAVAGTTLTNLDATETVTSPTFTFSGATPQAATVTFDSRANLGPLVGLNGGVTITARLHDVTANTSAQVASTALTASSTAFATTAGSLSPSLLVSGHSYELVVSENISPLVFLVGTATIDLDNVFLDVTPAAPPAPVLSGSPAISRVTSSSAQATATVDPGSADTTVRVDYGTTTGYGNHVGQILAANSGATAVTEPISGLAPSTTYHARVVATSSAGTTTSTDLVFTTSAATGASPPAVSDSGVDGSPDERAATLGAGVDTGGTGGTYHVEYGTSTAYGMATTPISLAAGTTGAVPVTVDLDGLTPGTVYHARFVADGPGGTGDGPDIPFTTAAATPPTATAPTFAAENSAGTAITLTTTVNPGSEDTQVSVDYGTTTSYGSTTSTQTVPGASGPTTVQFVISGLTANTLYHFRVNATNLDATVHTADTTDTPTATAQPPVGPTSLISLDENSATLESSIDPGGASATYSLRYGTSPSSLTLSTSSGSIAAGTSGPQPLLRTLSGLIPGTTYYAQFVVVLASGTSVGQIVQFQTDPTSPPQIDQSSVTNVSTTSVEVRVVIDPGAHPTTVHVDYGPTSNYGVSGDPITVPADAGPTALVFVLRGLTPGSSYHARLVSANSDSTVSSGDLAFATSASPVVPGTTPTTPPTTPPTTTTAPATTRPTAITPPSVPAKNPVSGSGRTACVAAYVSASPRVRSLVHVPASAEVTAAHGLRIAIALRARLHGRASYRIGTGHPVTAVGGRFSLGVRQLAIGRTTHLTVVVPGSHGRRTRLRLAIGGLACGPQLTSRRDGASLAITARSPGVTRTITFTVPAGWQDPRSLTLLGPTRTGALRLVGTGRSLHLAATSGHLRIAHSGRSITVSGLSSQTTGVTLAFPGPGAHGTVHVRVSGGHRPARSAHITVGGRGAR